MEFNVKAIFDADVSNAERKINDFVDKAKHVQGIAEPSAQPPVFEKSVSNNELLLDQYQSAQVDKNARINDELGNLVRKLKDVSDLMPIFSNNLRNLSNSFTSNNISTKKEKENKDDFENLKKSGILTLATAATAGFLQYDTFQTRKRISQLNADVFGVEHETVQGYANTVSSVTSVATSAAPLIGFLLGGPGGSLIGAAIGKGIEQLVDSTVGAAASNSDAKITEKETQARIFQEKTPSLEKNILLYADPNEKPFSNNSIDNRAKIIERNSYFNNENKNLGISNQDFIEYANSLAGYGVKTKGISTDLVQSAGKLSKATGVDIGEFLDIAGFNYFVNSSNKKGYDTDKHLNTSIVYAREAGLTNGQLPEFLNGLRGAVEQGLSRGATVQFEDIAKQIYMFSKLSDGDKAWSGKYAFDKLSQINGGLAQATNLSNSGQILAYQAVRGLLSRGEDIKGGSFIEGEDALNTLSILESGLNSKTFNAISKTIKNTYGNDVMSQVAAWKEISGLNYSGSMKLYEMSQKGELEGLTDDQIRDKINKLLSNSDYQTDSTKIVDKLGDIESSVLKISENGLEVYLNGLEELAEDVQTRARTEKGKSSYSSSKGFDDLFENLNVQGENAEEFKKYIQEGMSGNSMYENDPRLYFRSLYAQFAPNGLDKDEIKVLKDALDNIAFKMDKFKSITIEG